MSTSERWPACHGSTMIADKMSKSHPESLRRIHVGNEISFMYVNHRGVDEQRNVQYIGTFFGTLKGFYDTPTYLMKGWCLARKDYRYFELSKIRSISNG